MGRKTPNHTAFSKSRHEQPVQQMDEQGIQCRKTGEKDTSERSRPQSSIDQSPRNKFISQTRGVHSPQKRGHLLQQRKSYFIPF